VIVELVTATVDPLTASPPPVRILAGAVALAEFPVIVLRSTFRWTLRLFESAIAPPSAELSVRPPVAVAALPFRVLRCIVTVPRFRSPPPLAPENEPPAASATAVLPLTVDRSIVAVAVLLLR